MFPLVRRAIRANLSLTSSRWLSSAVPLTTTTLPHLQRNPKFAKLTEADLQHFKTILPPEAVVTDPAEVEFNNMDWMKKYRGQSTLVLKPKHTKQVADILAYCNNRRIAVVPQGGNTGLVGGSVSVFDEVVISMANMNKVIQFDEVSGILTCEAGCILENVDKYLEQRGYIMPLDLGAKGSCQIGGNVATNAGGLRLLRFGSLRGTVLGLEMVLPNGTVVNNLSSLRKDNTGYDLKQLFIGSEGTLGIITKVVILTPKRPKTNNVAILGFSSYDKILEAFKRTRAELGEILSAFEFFDRKCLELTVERLGTRDPLSDPHKFYALIETGGSNKEHDDAKLSSLLEGLFGNNITLDGTVAQDNAQIAAFWKIREGITLALGKVPGRNYKYDLSVPVTKLYEIVEIMKERLAGEASAVVGYGHMGDGNLHLNIVSEKPEVVKKIEPYVYEWTSTHLGSISAEHGLGVMKAPYLHYSKSPESISLMAQVKALFDPNGIMNPYKYLPNKH